MKVQTDSLQLQKLWETGSFGSNQLTPLLYKKLLARLEYLNYVDSLELFEKWIFLKKSLPLRSDGSHLAQPPTSENEYYVLIEDPFFIKIRVNVQPALDCILLAWIELQQNHSYISLN